MGTTDFFIPTSGAHQPLPSKFRLKNAFLSFTYSPVLADNTMEQIWSVVVLIIYHLSLLPVFKVKLILFQAVNYFLHYTFTN